ncbi:MAG: hypothetical protein ACREXT_07210, partial [Gammaproteobacteria bacterium]
MATCAHFFESYRNRVEAERLARSTANAITIAQRLGDVVKPVYLALAELAKDPKVVAALTGADEVARKQLGADLKSRVPNALLLRLIPRGLTQTDPDSNPPLTYASLDLLLKAERQEKPTGAEIHLAGTPMEHIALVVRVPPAGDPVGFLHASLDSKAIREAFTVVLSKAHSRAAIQQPVPGAAPVMIATTAQLSKGNTPTVTQNVPGTAWVMALQTGDSAISIGSTYAEIGLPVALVLLGVWWWQQRRQVATATVVHTATVYAGAIKAILAGEHPGLAQLLPEYDGEQHKLQEIPLAHRLHGEDIIVAPTAPVAYNTAAAPAPSVGEADTAIAASIFRRYDIRGIVDETLTVEAVYQIGRAFGSEAIAREQRTVIVARDGRNSSVSFRGALVEGLRDAGCE